MLSLASASRVIVHPGATDMRYGIWGLRSKAGELRDGDVHMFCSADRRTVKILAAEGGSLWMLQKRMLSGRFQWPSSGALTKVGLLQMQWLLDGPGQIAAMEAGIPAGNPFRN